MAVDVIKSFLVRLGFQSDTDSLKNFTSGVETAGKAVFALGAALEGTALAIAIGVSKIAGNLEALYFASQKTGDSATQLKAFDIAAQRMGASAGTGLGAVQTLAAYIRNNPPGVPQGTIDSWFGAGTFDAHDKLKTLLNMGEAMQKMDYFLARARGNAVGLSDDQVWFLRQGKFAQTYAEILKTFHGNDLDKAAEDANRFKNSLTLLEVTLEAFGARVVDVLEKRLGGNLESLRAWLNANGDALATKIVGALSGLLDLAEKLQPKIEWLWNKLKDLDEATGGWSTNILLAAIAVKALTGANLIGGIWSLGAAFIGLSNTLAGFAVGGVLAGVTALGGILVILAGLTGAGFGWLLNRAFPKIAENLSRGVGYLIDGPEKPSTTGHITGRINRAAPPVSSGVDERQASLIRTLIGEGVPPGEALAMSNVARAENATLDPNQQQVGGPAYGTFQWEGPRQKEFFKHMGFDIHGSTLEQQGKFAAWERAGGDAGAARAALLSNGVTNQAQMRENYVRNFEAPKNPEAEIARATHIAMNTTIQIDGSGEPHAVAKLVTDAQERTAKSNAAALTREFAATVQ